MSMKKKIFVGAGIGIIGMYFVVRLIRRKRYWQNQFMLGEWKSKVILITGCDTGFGYHTAIKLDRMGYSVVATCLKQDSVDQFLDSDQSNFYVNSIAYKMDVTNMDDIKNVKDMLTKYLNDNNKILWGIVNNAGFALAGNFEVIPLKYQKSLLDTIFVAPTVISKVFLPLLYGRKNIKTLGKDVQNTCNGGRIVNISSPSRGILSTSFVLYGASKIGLSYHTHCLRMELKPLFGIHCSVIEPGFFNTSMISNLPKFGNKFKKECNKDVWELYKCDHFYNNDLSSSVDIILHKLCNNNIDYVANDIIHALTSKYPKNEYFTKWGLWSIYSALVSLCPLSWIEYMESRMILARFNP